MLYTYIYLYILYIFVYIHTYMLVDCMLKLYMLNPEYHIIFHLASFDI